MEYLNKKKKGRLLVLGVAAVLIFTGCGKGKSEEDRIEEMFDHISRQVEQENTDGIVHYLSEDFSDFEDRSRTDVRALVEEHFNRFRDIVFHLLSVKILFVHGDSAEVEAEISLSSGAAKMFRKLIKFAGHLYRFKLDLRKTGREWKITYAEWRYTTIDQLYPESFKVLRKIFPNI